MLVIIIFQVAWRGLADGAQRRGITGSSGPMLIYPIVESAEHKSQLGDLSIFQDKPTRSVQDTIDAKIEFDTLLQGMKRSNSLAHKSENVYNLSDILILDHNVRTYFMDPHKIVHFAGSGHRRILKLWGGNLLSRDP